MIFRRRFLVAEYIRATRRPKKSCFVQRKRATCATLRLSVCALTTALTSTRLFILSKTEHNGTVTGEDAVKILEKAEEKDPGAEKRILIKGDATVSSEAAKVFASKKILLVGNESQTVGPEDAPMEVHLILLGSGVVLLEGIRLADVPEGVYFLNAAPLNLSGADGSPCRAILIDAGE